MYAKCTRPSAKREVQKEREARGPERTEREVREIRGCG